LGEKSFHKLRILADFENPQQEQLFRLHPSSSGGQVQISPARARRQTGSASLQMSFQSSRQWVSFTGTLAEGPGLRRDWTDYHLLSFSIFSPRKLGGFRLALCSGNEMQFNYEHQRILLERGWNLIRIDLGELAEHVDLGNVRQLRFYCKPLDTPIDLYLDDLLLIDNTRNILSTPQNENGSLYVQKRGRRLAVGSVDRFELVFSRGRIVKWFDLDHDPHRLRNLTGTGPLGPLPVVLTDTSPDAEVLIDDPSQWSPLGMAVETYQSLVEANELYVLLRGEWRFCTTETAPDKTNPYHQWIYAIYPDGRIYVECSGTARQGKFQPPAVGMAFCCDGDLGFGPQSFDLPQTPEKQSETAHKCALFARNETGQADLLIAPYATMPFRILRHTRDPRIAAMWTLPNSGKQFLFAGLLRVWPPQLNDTTNAQSVASKYCKPLNIHCDTGHLVRTDPGDWDNDGFNEAAGYYTLQLDGGHARLNIDRKNRPDFDPLFKIVGLGERQLWVYINGRRHQDLQRDRNGDVIFALPDTPPNNVLVEIAAGQQTPSSEKQN